MSLKAACFGNNVFRTSSATKCISNLLAVGYRRLSIDLYWSPDRRAWSFCPVAIPTEPPSGTASSSSASSLHQLGPYSCSDDLNINSLLEVLQGFFQRTNSQFNAYTTYMILNLHVAASDSAPDRPRPSLSESQRPTSAESIGRLLDKSLSMYIYRPGDLAEERSNLNKSWYAVEEGFKPIVEYFTIRELPNGKQSTPDGWPNSKFVQLAKQRRVLFGYGSIHPHLDGLNTAIDDDVVFPPGYLTTWHDVSISHNYTLESGCLYNPEASLVSKVNSSWAMTSRIPLRNSPPTPERLHQLSAMVVDLASCGLSPFLKSTILNTTADEDIDPYRNISLSSSWAWATGEPRHATGRTGGNGHNRCALMDLSLAGHWRAADCDEVRPAACRVANMPYLWTLSNGAAKYSDGSSICPDNSSFSVPRTGLENSYLFQHALGEPNNIIDPASSDPAKREIWLDFNSLKIDSCWVTGGRQAGCPYASDPQQLERRTVLISTIAGIVVCIIAALTLFVKCNANRRNLRRRRRVIAGWEYEGVPS